MLPRHAELWLPGLVKQRLSRGRAPGPADVYFCFADHYEPGWRGAAFDRQQMRVSKWIQQYPTIASRHHDSDGRHPQHTFFYPQEEYHPEHIERLAALCRRGFGDIEVHLHHDRDTAVGFREKLTSFITTLRSRHGLLREDHDGRVRYGFIHGNWTLNNSHPEGRWCGVDDETSILIDTGCYADFTMPCGPEPSQVRTVNQIYYAMPRKRSRAHERGPMAAVGISPAAGLLMITGPLGINWRSRRLGLIPRLDYGDVAWHSPVSADRVRLWCNRRIQVGGAPEHIFVKVCTHGAQESNAKYLLEGGLENLWRALNEVCRDEGHRLHYVTAYEMFLKVRAIESHEEPHATIGGRQQELRA